MALLLGTCFPLSLDIIFPGAVTLPRVTGSVRCIVRAWAVSVGSCHGSHDGCHGRSAIVVAGGLTLCRMV